MLALDHGGQIVAQDDLAAGGVLRGDHINGLVGVHVGKAVLGQLVGKAGAITCVPSRQSTVSTMVLCW